MVLKVKVIQVIRNTTRTKRYKIIVKTKVFYNVGFCKQENMV